MLDDALFNRLCYVFTACGISDLRAAVRADDSNGSISFIQPSSPHPHPRNGFFCADADCSRFRENVAVYDRMMALGEDPFIQGKKVSITIVEAFLSLANYTRSLLERRMIGAGDLTTEYDRVYRMYGNTVILTQDEMALQMLEIIERRADRVTFCSVDESVENPAPMSVRALVAEGFAGMALVSYYRKSVSQVWFFSFAFTLYSHLLLLLLTPSLSTTGYQLRRRVPLRAPVRAAVRQLHPPGRRVAERRCRAHGRYRDGVAALLLAQQ